MRVFVTGGNGFIGSVVVRKLVAGGHQVVCLLRPRSRTDRIDGVPYERAEGDVTESDTVAAALTRCDATIHLAAPGGWGGDTPRTLEQVIVGGTANVLAAAEATPDHRIIIVSSAAAIASSASPRVFDERAAFDVGDASLHYSHAKHRAERLALEACARGTHAVIVNPVEVYGPGDSQLVTAGNLLDFATSTPVLACDGGTGVVHVGDVADGILAALERGRPAERYILGGENLSIEALARLVLELTGRRASVFRVPNGLALAVARVALRAGIPLPFDPHVVPYATRYWFMDSSKARRELGISFRNARDTIGETLRWLEHAGHLKPRRPSTD